MARELKYPKSSSLMMSQETYDRLQAIADPFRISLGDVMRQAIEAGLPSVEADYAGRTPPADAGQS